MHIFRKLNAVLALAAMLQPTLASAEVFYFRVKAGGAVQTNAAPPSPVTDGSFAIVVDGKDYAVTGTTYSATSYPYNAQGAVNYSVLSGALPAGISVSPVTGTVSGPPTTKGTTKATIQAFDTVAGVSAQAVLTIDVIDPLTISSSPGPVVYTGTPYSVSFFLAGGGAPYGFSQPVLPAGLAFAPSATSGLLSGMPSVPGVYPITVTGSEKHGLSVGYPFTLTVVAPPSLNGTPTPTANQGSAYSSGFTTAGGMAPFNYVLAAGTLPGGVGLNSQTGTISGTPSFVQNKTGIRLKVTDVNGATATSPVFSINVAGPASLTISGTPPATAEQNQPYSGQFIAAGGTGNRAFSLVAGTLPPGISLSASTGALTGVPTAAGDFQGLQVRVADAASRTALSGVFSISVAAPVVLPLTLSGTPSTSVNVGQAYSVKFTAAGGTGGYVYSLGGSALPPGLSLNGSTGLVVGSPSVAGVYPDISVKATDSAGSSIVSAAFSIAVSSPLAVAGSTGSFVLQGDDYSAQFLASGGSGGYVFSLGGGTLPPGMTLSPSGLLSGSSNTPGTYTGIVVQVADSASQTALSTPRTITVGAIVPLTISQGSSATVKINESYGSTFTAFDGSGKGYVFSSVGGALPPGVALLEATPGSASLSGRPTVAGTYSGIQIKVVDSRGGVAVTEPFTVTVDYGPVTVSGSGGGAMEGVSYSSQFAALGGSGSGYVYALASGTLPSGIALDAASGLIGGTPAAGSAGSYGGLQVKATDSAGGTGVSFGFSITVGSPPPPVEPASPLQLYGSAGAGTLDQPYAAQFSAGGGTPEYAYEIFGTFPAGLSFGATTGAISGTPTVLGESGPLSVKVTDAAGATVISASFTIVVSDPNPISVSWSPGVGQVGQSYSASVNVSGGVSSSYVWSFSGTLPPGLGQSASGGVSGIPNVAGNFGPVVLTVTDGVRSATTAPATISIGVPPLTISWSPATSIQTGQFVAEAVTATGGNGGTLTFGYSGALPTGLLQSDGNGAISGLASAAGTFGPVFITVTDGDQAAVTSPAVTFTVTDPPPPQSGVAVAADFPPGMINHYYTGTVVETGGSGNYTRTVGGGSLPPGLSIWGNTLNGFPTVAGLFGPYTVTSVDNSGTGSGVSVPRAIEIVPEMRTTVQQQNGVQNRFFSGNAVTTVTGGKAPYTYSTDGTLPAGLSLDPATGIVSGTPLQEGYVAYLHMFVTDAYGFRVTTDYFWYHFDSVPTLYGNLDGGATQGKPYNSGFYVDKGVGPFTITASTPPVAGLQFVWEGWVRLYGNPQQFGTFPYSVTIADANGSVATRSGTFTVNEGMTAFWNGNGGAVVGQYYSTTVGTKNSQGVSDMTCAPLPAGLQTNVYGNIWGYPSAGSQGDYPMTCTLTDGYGWKATVPVHLTVVALPPLLDPKFPDGSLGVPYSYQLPVTGGQGPYTVTLAAGVFPDGLTLDSTTGILAGTPTVKGHFDVQLKAVDSLGLESYSGWRSIEVYQENGLVIGGSITYDFMVNRSPWQSFDGHNGLFSGTLTGGDGRECGWSYPGLDEAGRAAIGAGGNGNFFSGPNVGTWGPFYVQAIDCSHNRAIKGPYTVTIWPEIIVSATPEPPVAYVNFPYYFPMQVIGGKPKITCTAGVPVGLTADPDTCVVSGMTAYADRGFPQYFTATDASGYNSTRIWWVGSANADATSCSEGGTYTVPPYETLIIRMRGGGGASSAVTRFGVDSPIQYFRALGGEDQMNGGDTTISAGDISLIAPGGIGGNGMFDGGRGTVGNLTRVPTVYPIPMLTPTLVQGIQGDTGFCGETDSSVPIFRGDFTAGGGTAAGPGGGIGAPSGRYGGAMAGVAGGAPGGGAAGAAGADSFFTVTGGGGGAAGYLEVVFTAGEIPVGTVLNCSVGKGGKPPEHYLVVLPGASGGDGDIKIVANGYAHGNYLLEAAR